VTFFIAGNRFRNPLIKNDQNRAGLQWSSATTLVPKEATGSRAIDAATQRDAQSMAWLVSANLISSPFGKIFPIRGAL
jgi:hypothetical protein